MRALAEKLTCHTTFVSQVLSGKNHFSLEQGLKVAEHFGFSNEETDFFLNLILRDRAGTIQLRDLFQRKLDAKLEQRLDLKENFKTTPNSTARFEAEYFGNWMYQAIHALTQIPTLRSARLLAKTLHLSSEEVTNILTRLEEMGLVEREGSEWRSKENFIHLPKEARAIRSLHSSWRMKALADFQTKPIAQGTHYSGIITAAEADLPKIRGVLVQALKEIRMIVQSSESEKGYILGVDCYEV